MLYEYLHVPIRPLFVVYYLSSETFSKVYGGGLHYIITSLILPTPIKLQLLDSRDHTPSGKSTKCKHLRDECSDVFREETYLAALQYAE